MGTLCLNCRFFFRPQIVVGVDEPPFFCLTAQRYCLFFGSGGVGGCVSSPYWQDLRALLQDVATEAREDLKASKVVRCQHTHTHTQRERRAQSLAS